MPILASLCNVKPASFNLVLIEDGLADARHIRLSPDLQTVGITGLAVRERVLYVQTQDTRLAVFDAGNLHLLGMHYNRNVQAPHSILIKDGYGLVVSTGTDSVCRLGMQDGLIISDDILWRPDVAVGPVDEHHLNSLCCAEGRVLVSGFGRRVGAVWSCARDGFVQDIGSGAVLVSGLHHPHSLMWHGGAVLLCESGNGTVRTLDGRRSVSLHGYTRGLCATAAGVYAATSRGRSVSRSTGAVISKPGDPGDYVGQSAVHLLDPVTLNVKARIDLTHLGDEIYDLVPVGPEALLWPAV